MNSDPLGPNRKRLLGLAYRMLGSRTEAEDILQDAWLRFRKAPEIKSPDALLTTIVTRLCLDRLKRLRRERRAYAGPWLPEPVADAHQLSPDSASELADDLSFALLLTLERLSPGERAAFLLHDVFDMPFADVAATLDRREATCRQLASRARKAVRAERPVTKASDEVHGRLLAAFAMAALNGDIAALSGLLREDAVLLADGGGEVLAALNPINGADRIARFLGGIVRKFSPGIDQIRVAIRLINGIPAIVVHAGDRIDQIVVLAVEVERIATVYMIRNPKKLAAIALIDE